MNPASLTTPATGHFKPTIPYWGVPLQLLLPTSTMLIVPDTLPSSPATISILYRCFSVHVPAGE